MFYSVKTAKCIPHKIENPKKKKIALPRNDMYSCKQTCFFSLPTVNKVKVFNVLP